MLTFDEARARLLANPRRLSAERVPVGEAAGRVLASDVVSRDPLPNFDQSAMDGYAFDLAGLTGEGPWALPVDGESAAGARTPELREGTACRIFTGAPIPRGADTVVMQEHVRREGDVVHLETLPARGQNVRRAGEDMAPETVALATGTRLSAGAIALAAMLGRRELIVARRPRVTILCTGDELRAADDEPRAASIPESNSAALAALARQAGAVVQIMPIARDDGDETWRAIEDGLSEADLLLTVGGVSVGDRDVVRPSLERAGVALDFWQVAIKPGKPLAVGARGNVLVLGLPGNPASAIVTFAVFGMPVLRVLQGDARPLPLAFPARLGAARKRSADRLELVRARLGVELGFLVARAHGNQASGAATNLASSDGLALVPPGDEPIGVETPVDFLRWSDV